MSRMGEEFIRTEQARDDMAAYEASYLAHRLANFAALVQHMRLVQEACFCCENRFDERRRLEAQVDRETKALRPDLAPAPVAPVDADDEMPF
jgi:hypothetical protein